MPYKVISVNRKEYKASIAKIDDQKSRGFAELSLWWWDRHFSWSGGGSVILTDDAGRHLCYLFYKIDRYKEYLTIHNLLTPFCHRRQGYAYLLLQWVFEQAVQDHVSRFRATCVPQSLEFYLSLGFCFWGLTGTKDYYCNLPMPSAGLGGLTEMVDVSSIELLVGAALQTIYDKVSENETGLDAGEQRIHKKGMTTLKGAYKQDQLMRCMEDEKAANP